VFFLVKCIANVLQTFLEEGFVLCLWVSVVFPDFCQAFVDDWVTELPPGLLCSRKRSNGLGEVVVLGQRDALEQVQIILTCGIEIVTQLQEIVKVTKSIEEFALTEVSI
jgi:hypothetical protein